MMLTNKVYDVLKWITVFFLPAAGALYVGLAQIWGFPYAEQVAGTVMAVVTFLGVLLQISNYQYKKFTVSNPSVLDYANEQPGMNILTDEAFAQLVNKE